MGKRHQARELAVKVLFHLEYNPGDPAEAFALISESFKFPETIRAFAGQLVSGVWQQKTEIDRLISRSSKHWRLERMPHTDRNILRLAVFEVLFLKDIPPKVSIDEAVELGKKFGAQESGAFINGILDHIYSHLPEQEGNGNLQRPSPDRTDAEPPAVSCQSGQGPKRTE